MNLSNCNVALKKKSCCFTGHRDIPTDLLPILKIILNKKKENMILNGINSFYCGGAVGFDILAEKAVLKFKEKYDNVNLIVAVPYSEQSKYFSEIQKQEYDYIISHADKVIVFSDHYYRGCMHKRNRYMVDSSDHCICYLTKYKGGTAYTVKYTKKRSLNIINIADELI